MKKRIGALLVALCLLLSCIPAVFAATTVPKVDYCNISYEDSIFIWFALDTQNTNTQILVWKEPQEVYEKGTEDAVLQSNGTVRINGKTCLTYKYNNLTAKQMTDTIYACACVGGVCGAPVKYSILTYAFNTLSKSTSLAIRESLTAMLRYGAALQKQFNYHTERLATDDYYKISAVGGVHSDGFTYGLFKEGDEFTMTAPEYDADGFGFNCWEDKQGTSVSTDRVFHSTVGTASETYTAVYEESEIPEANLLLAPGWDGDWNLRFMTDIDGLDYTTNKQINPLSGGVYIDGVLTSNTVLGAGTKNTFYFYFGGSCIEGRTVSLDGVFTDGTNNVRFKPTTFTYSGGKWHTDTKVMVANGMSAYNIVRGSSATATEITAATELQSYIKKMTGAQLPIVTDATAATDNEIVVGRTNREASGAYDRTQLGEEGYSIKTDGSKLFLVGGGDRGTLYSVYGFLENYCGCRFYTDMVEKVEQYTVFSLPNIPEDIQKPVFGYRSVNSIEYRRTDISLKRNLNVELWDRSLPANVGGGHEYAYGAGGHTYFSFVDPNTYFSSHPEYFSYINYRRVNNKQLCLTNANVLNLTIQGVYNWLDANPEADIISVSPNDTDGFCMCSNCKKLYSQNGGAYSAAAIDFANKVAAAVKEHYPNRNIMVHTFAYSTTRSAPTNIVPADNVLVSLATMGTCFNHPKETQTCNMPCAASKTDGTHNTFAEDLEAWSAISDNLIIYDYGYDAIHPLSIFPNFEALRQDLAYYARNGILGVELEGNGNGSPAFDELRAYLLSKLLWNPNMTSEQYYAYMDDFLEGVYGPGASYLRTYIDLAMQQANCFNLDSSPYDLFPFTTVTKHATTAFPSDLTAQMLKNYDGVNWTAYWNWCTDLEESSIAMQCTDLFEQAMALAETPAQRAQIEKVSCQQMYLQLYCSKKRIEIGRDTFVQMIKAFMNANAADFSGVDKTALATKIENTAIQQLYKEFADIGRNLAQTMAEQNITSYYGGKFISGWENFNFFNLPVDWQSNVKTVNQSLYQTDSTIWVQTSSSDSNPYSSSEWAYKYTAAYGGVYVDGVKTDIPLIKVGARLYLIRPQDYGYMLTEGMQVTVDMTIVGTGGAVKLNPASYVYHNGSWSTFKTALIYDSTFQDTCLRFEVDGNDTLSYAGDTSVKYSAIAGGVYIDGVKNDLVKLSKYDYNKYIILWSEAGVTPTKDMQVTIDGVFGSGSQFVKFDSTTFTYDGNLNWYLHLNADAEGRSDGTLWIKTGANDTLPYDVNWNYKYYAKSGGVYINGSLVNRPLIKIFADTYIVQMTSPTTGMTCVVDGLFGDSTNSFIFDNVTFRFNADLGVYGTWEKVRGEARLNIIGSDAAGTNLHFKSVGEDDIEQGSYAADAWLTGGVSIDSGTALHLPVRKTSASDYEIDFTGVAPVQGTVAEVGGKFTDGDCTVNFNSAAFYYDGSKWAPIIAIDVTVDTSRTGEYMLFMRTTASLPEASYNGYAWYAARWNNDYGFKYNGNGKAVQFYYTSGIIYTCNDFNSPRADGDYVDIHGVTSFDGVMVYFRPAHFVWSTGLNRWTQG